MRVLITGASGQIGTNLALRLQRDGHWVFGVDKRPNTWIDDEFRYLLQDLAIHYPAFRGGIGGVEYPEVDVVVHLAAHAKVHQLVRQPHRALENLIMTHNVLEYARQLDLPVVFSSTREVYGDVHRFEEYDESTADFAYTESPYSASKIASEAFIYSYARCYGLRYLVFRFSNVYGRFDSDLQRMERVIPLFIDQLSRGEPVTVYGGEEKVLDFTYIDDCIDGIARGIERLAADRARAGRRAPDQLRAGAARRGHPLRRRHPQGARAPGLAALDAARPGDPEGGRVVPRLARGPSRRRGAGARRRPRRRPRRRDAARLQAAGGDLTVCRARTSSPSSGRRRAARPPSPGRSARGSGLRSSRPTRPRCTPASRS